MKTNHHVETSCRRSRQIVSFIRTLAVVLLLSGSGAVMVHAQGVLTNGENHDGTVLTAGATETWTISANTGDQIVVQVGKLTGGAGFTPRIELFAPDGATQGPASDSVAARLNIQAHVSGVFSVVVSDLNRTGTGTYRLRYANVPQSFITPVGDEGGALGNGAEHDGVISVGDLDLWTFSGTVGGRAVVQVAETAGGAGFTPQIEVFSPTGYKLGRTSGAVAGRLDFQTGVAGTYTVLVSDLNRTGAGSYRLRLAQVPDAFSIPAGDEGGALSNGGSHSGTIDIGDSDLWTLNANAGDRIVLQVGEVSGAAAFAPMLELFAPDGTRLAFGSDAVVARLDVHAPVSGNYTVLVSDATVAGGGTYQLQLAQIPAALTIPGGDEGGVLADAVNTDGAIALGDLDLWTFNATPGDLITVQATELTGGATFAPMIELFTPTGARKAFAQNATVATLQAAIESAGTYTVLVSDATRTGTGTYRLNLTRGAIAPAGANMLVNGQAQLGSISVAAQTDDWAFTASAGETVVVRMGETATAGLVPWLRLFDPNGVLLVQDFNAAAAEVTVRAVTNGTFRVTAADGSAGRNQTGNYRISLAKTGSPLTISPGDEGGTLTNGTTYQAAISTGDIDAWTFTANVGETVLVRMGEIATGGFTPWLRLYGPDGVLLSGNFNAGAAEVLARVTNSGSFLVVVGDGSSGIGNSANYRISLAKTGGLPAISPSDEGGPMVNGTTYLAAIDTGDIDAWTFTANVGESILVRMGETGATAFQPWLRLYGPEGTLLSGDFNAGAAEVVARATNSGTFLVVVGDGSSGIGSSGNYRISLVRTGGPLAISQTDEGGALPNGTTQVAGIDTGDIDAWTFTANVGESIVVRMGETGATAFQPWLRLYGPEGTLLSGDFNAGAAEVVARATNSGTFLVIVGDGSSGIGNSGNYRISLAKTGSQPVIGVVDEGGPMVNGSTYLATVETGDIDAWTLVANAGESIVVRMGETAVAGLTPWLRLYSPNGVLLSSSFNAAAAEVTARATNSGTFLVVAGDGSSGIGNSGNYRISLAKTGSPLVISNTDEGGALINGATQLATIETGDLDAWTLSADAGETIIVRMGETTAATLTPWLRLYGPDGALLHTDFNAAAAEVTVRATNSGTFLVVAGDGSSGIGNSGNYRINLALAPEKFSTSPGDDGGAVPQLSAALGDITTGDLDLWSFEANAGNVLNFQLQEQAGTALTPWLRLYDAHGQLLRSSFHASLAQFQITVPQSGLYFIVVSDGSSGIAGTGSYSLSVTGLPEQGKQLRYEHPTSASLLINWPSELTGYVLQENPVLQTAGWTDVTVPASFDNGFNVRITIPIPTTGNRFYRLRPPIQP